jgi:hypothetical protein
LVNYYENYIPTITKFCQKFLLCGAMNEPGKGLPQLPPAKSRSLYLSISPTHLYIQFFSP